MRRRYNEGTTPPQSSHTVRLALLGVLLIGLGEFSGWYGGTHNQPTTDTLRNQAAHVQAPTGYRCWLELHATGTLLEEICQPAGAKLTPKCQEDETVQGVGDFTRGYWTKYECAHDNR